MIFYFGPVDSTAHESSGSWVPIVCGVLAMAAGWRHFILHREDEKLAISGILWLSLVCTLMIIAGICGLWKFK